MPRSCPALLAVVVLAIGAASPARAADAPAPPAADLELTGSAPVEVANSERFTHAYTVRNLGPATAVAVVVEGVDHTEFGGSCPLSKCALGDLAPGATATVEAVWVEPAVFPPFPGTFRSAARVTSGTPDPNPANDAAALSTYRRPYVGPPVGGPELPVAPPATCARVTTGSRGTDHLQASALGDQLVGLAGADVLRGGRGADCLWGGAGADRLIGGRGDDRLFGGSGHDRLMAGAGDDHVEALDATRDVIDCGPGRDWVRADRRDRLRSCERVTHRLPTGVPAA